MNIADIHRVSKLLVSRVNHNHIKELIYKIPKDVVIVVLFILGLLVSFGFGVIAGKQMKQGSIIVETIPLPIPPKHNVKTDISNNALFKDSRVVASKNGSKYYFSWCSGAKRLSNKTKIWFSSVSEAQKSGYSKASNCKGL